MKIIEPCDFTVNRYIGCGCYSIVYEVTKLNGQDSGSTYALKRFFLEDEGSIKCVLRERRILERLSLAEFQSSFLPKLCYSIWSYFVSAFVLREGSGCDLYDLLCHVGNLTEAQTKFYIAEVVCGLEHLHSLNIVHLDIKPENILFYPSGHIFVSDLDRSFDLSLNTKPTLDDFTGTPLFMAPEIARGEVIDLRSDVWSLGVLAAELTAGPIRPESRTTEEAFRRARMGTYNIIGLKRLSKPLQSFFSACLQTQYSQRPYLKGVKGLRFLKSIDWEKANACLLKPPYSAAELKHIPAKKHRIPVSSTDVRLLSGAFNKNKPVYFDSLKKENATQNEFHDSVTRQSCVIPNSLTSRGYTEDKLNDLFKTFAFTHPEYRSDSNAVTSITDIVKELKISSLPENKTAVHELFTNILGQFQDCAVDVPSNFRRSRTRGISIGE